MVHIASVFISSFTIYPRFQYLLPLKLNQLTRASHSLLLFLFLLASVLLSSRLRFFFFFFYFFLSNIKCCGSRDKEQEEDKIKKEKKNPIGPFCPVYNFYFHHSQIKQDTRILDQRLFHFFKKERKRKKKQKFQATRKCWCYFSLLSLLFLLASCTHTLSWPGCISLMHGDVSCVMYWWIERVHNAFWWE